MLHPFDFTDCRVRCRYPCSIFLGRRGWFIRHLEVAKKERQANTGGYKRCDDDSHCEKDRQVARRKRGPIVHDEREGQYARQRNGATHPGKRSEEHTSELQSLMRISYAVFCLKKKK